MLLSERQPTGIKYTDCILYLGVSRFKENHFQDQAETYGYDK
jgi:hypothetical protein